MTKHAQGTLVPSPSPHQQEQLSAQRKANDAAACAVMLDIMSPVWPPSAGAGQPSTSTLSVDQLMQAAFYNGRTPRSAEYKAGTRALLENRIEQKDIVPPYQAGTTEADAYFAGIEEGKSIWRAAVAKNGGAA
jgi:hypothetical protein